MTKACLALGGGALSPLIDQTVDLGHEGVEVGAALATNGGRVEEQVHEHGLAPPDRPPKIDTLDATQGLWLAKQRKALRFLRCLEIALEPRQGLNGGLLRDIEADCSGLKALGIGGLK